MTFNISEDRSQILLVHFFKLGLKGQQIVVVLLIDYKFKHSIETVDNMNLTSSQVTSRPQNKCTSSHLIWSFGTVSGKSIWGFLEFGTNWLFNSLTYSFLSLPNRCDWQLLSISSTSFSLSQCHRQIIIIDNVRSTQKLTR